MTREEVLRRYKIPAQILDEYEPQGQEYNDSDIERISTIMTLNDIGFKKEDITNRRYSFTLTTLH